VQNLKKWSNSKTCHQHGALCSPTENAVNFAYMYNLELNSVARLSIVWLHLLAFAIAASGVAFGDVAIFRKRRVDVKMLGIAARLVTFALVSLWLTGLAIIGFDTRFDMTNLMQNTKLLAKLTVVIALSINGVLLHRLAFPRFSIAQDEPHDAATLPAVLGGISASTWLFAAFMGVAKPLAPALSYTGFIALYGVAVSLAIAVSLIFIRPLLAVRMSQTKPVHDVIAEHAQLKHPLDRAVARIGRLLEEIDTLTGKLAKSQTQRKEQAAELMKLRKRLAAAKQHVQHKS
jgi:hypothetical protein